MATQGDRRDTRRDTRRDLFLETTVTIGVANVVLFAWLATGPRSSIESLLVWFAATTIATLGYSRITGKRWRGVRYLFRREPWQWAPDRVIGLVVVLIFTTLNLTWPIWLPGAGESSAHLYRWWLPDSYDALRYGLIFIVGTSLMVPVWVVLRLAFPARHSSGPADATVATV